MSGRVAGEVLAVDRARYRATALAVLIATSPPFGSIQWNLRFIDCLLFGLFQDAALFPFRAYRRLLSAIGV